ncbi:MAG: PadR family transcriptional regulator [Candidatus Aenigmatarchaeota archaeon]|nr:MAG: PadR family transcriptional regulator [Candidatus Aenigmarchaeota archaeon]
MGKHLKRLEKLNTTECLWVYVLKILSDGPSHAYVLRERIENEYGFKPGTVTAYKVLYDLQSLGLVTKKREGMKRIYEITDKGRKDLEKAIAFYEKLAQMLGKTSNTFKAPLEA